MEELGQCLVSGHGGFTLDEHAVAASSRHDGGELHGLGPVVEQEEQPAFGVNASGGLRNHVHAHTSTAERCTSSAQRGW